MASLYFVANSLNYLVAGTGNRSELAIGYFTKYGDGGVDLLPLGQLVKSEVWKLARELDVPAAIVDRTPTADSGSDRPMKTRWASATATLRGISPVDRKPFRPRSR